MYINLHNIKYNLIRRLHSIKESSLPANTPVPHDNESAESLEEETRDTDSEDQNSVGLGMAEEGDETIHASAP